MRLRLWVASIALACTPAAFAATQATPKSYAACIAVWLEKVEWYHINARTTGMWVTKAIATDLAKDDVEGLFGLHLSEAHRQGKSRVPSKEPSLILCHVGKTAASVRAALGRGKSTVFSEYEPFPDSMSIFGKCEHDDWLE